MTDPTDREANQVANLRQWGLEWAADELESLHAAKEVAEARADAARDAALKDAAEIVRGLAPRIDHDITQDDRMHKSILERAARHIETLATLDQPKEFDYD